MIHSQLIQSVKNGKMNLFPYHWSFINNLFSKEEQDNLLNTFPQDYENFKSVDGYDGEKGFTYKVRPLVHLRETKAYVPEKLDNNWQLLAETLISKEYREAISYLTGVDLMDTDIEINAFHYSAGSWMGSHVDIKEKIVTHVIYFNETWNINNGGNFNVLRSKDMSDAIVSITPLIGNSVLLVRSNTSWHSVTKVKEECSDIRKNIIVNFYPKDTQTIMWRK